MHSRAFTFSAHTFAFADLARKAGAFSGLQSQRLRAQAVVFAQGAQRIGRLALGAVDTIQPLQRVGLLRIQTHQAQQWPRLGIVRQFPGA